MKRILIVEDDAHAARALAVRIQALGHEACNAASIAQARSAIQRFTFDLLIVDINLPDGDGLALAEEFVGCPLAHGAPVLILTGTDDITRRLQASRLGAWGWLEKPYQPGELVTAVEMALNEKSSSPSHHRFSPLQPLFSRNTDEPRRKILVIEDDPRIARALMARFESAGYNPVLACDGRSGLAAAIEHRPSLVVSDLRMRGGLGFALMEELATRGLDGTPVIFMTASKKPGLREAAMESGATEFFEKPCDPALLLRVVRRTLADCA